MKNVFAISLISSTLFLGANPLRADWDYWGYKNETETINGFTGGFYNLYTINSASGQGTLRQRFCYSSNSSRMNNCHNQTGLPILRSPIDILYSEKHIDKDTLIIQQKLTDFSSETILKKYTLNGDVLSSETITDTSTNWYDDYAYRSIRGNAQIDSDGNYYSDVGGQMWIKQDSSGTISFGKTESSTPIYSLNESGVSLGGTNLISRSSDGVLSIGANSVKLEEVSDIQRIWATNSSGTKIPINIYGSDLQIDGVSVQSQIDTNTSNISTNTSNISTNTSNISTNTSNISTNTSNISTNTSNISTNTSNISTNTSAIESLQSSNNSSRTTITANKNNINKLGEGVAGSTALTAALTALPQTSKDSKLSCGIGTGAYSSRYAIGFGCASKLSDRFDVNAGGSYVLGGSKSYGDGTLDSGVIKAGFVFKLGELKNLDQISLKKEKVINTKITKMEKKNKELEAKNEQIFLQNQRLLARLEKLEKIAFDSQKNREIKLSKGY